MAQEVEAERRPTRGVREVEGASAGGGGRAPAGGGGEDTGGLGAGGHEEEGNSIGMGFSWCVW